jgi:predicted DNA-binding transcriptional regulator AlpA
MDEKEAALALRISSRSLRRAVARGEAPPPIKVGRLTRWRVADLEAWVARIASLSEAR